MLTACQQFSLKDIYNKQLSNHIPVAFQYKRHLYYISDVLGASNQQVSMLFLYKDCYSLRYHIRYRFCFSALFALYNQVRVQLTVTSLPVLNFIKRFTIKRFVKFCEQPCLCTLCDLCYILTVHGKVSTYIFVPAPSSDRTHHVIILTVINIVYIVSADRFLFFLNSLNLFFECSCAYIYIVVAILSTKVLKECQTVTQRLVTTGKYDE
eukprot:TRINITY_DN6706_c0_g1_i2.p4 TRINITY_DN6706_c0_g1~~TRINITY_DN6706_c0_g1_i2.p4  ORF type:complete len:209 (-),score=-20.38 TRINITY_DN6706_c0_g1_i2:314-940(-)